MKAETFTLPPDGNQNLAARLLIVLWLCNLAALVSSVVRVFVRSHITRNLGWDDYCIIGAQVLTLVGAGMVSAAVVNGLGRHEYYLTAVERRRINLLGWADWIQTFLNLMLIKISICVFLIRINNRAFIIRPLYVAIGVMILTTIICVGLFLGICVPLQARWDVGVNGKCLSKASEMWIVISQGIISIITDLICATFPYFFLKNLNISRRTKFGLCVLMGLGFITAACCIVRTVLSPAIKSQDASWDLVDNNIWRFPEVNLGIACANAPLFRPLYLRWRRRLRIQRPSPPDPAENIDRVWPSKPREVPSLFQVVSPVTTKFSSDSETSIAGRSPQPPREKSHSKWLNRPYSDLIGQPWITEDDLRIP